MYWPQPSERRRQGANLVLGGGMRDSTDGRTLFVPNARSTSRVDRVTLGLPPDLANRATMRLQVLAWLYAFTFFMAAYFPRLIFPDERKFLFERTVNWVPGLLSIAVAISVALAVRMSHLRPAAMIATALMFEVVGSYGIAAAEFLQPTGLDAGTPWVGLSWVAVFVLLFNVVAPAVPRYAVIAALTSVTSVPAMVTASISLFPPPTPPGGLEIFFRFGFPYLLVVIMAYVGARVVYNLGTEVTRARELGSYRLEHQLGEGGMGEVWKASHRLLARPAAIKLIRSSVAENGAFRLDDLRRRFEREAQVISQLRSPHTVTLFDFGLTEEGTFYYVMELLDGVDADTLIRRFGPIPAERVVHILRQMCHSLSEAESHGLVHRDIKPANIFLCRYGEDHDFVKVLDFGIAKALHGAPPDAQTIATMTHVIQGTPAFLAPEQALGAASVDARADIYSTGCVAYWLLTGELVFVADTPIQQLLAHAQAPPEPPSARTELPIPPDLDALVLSCLAKDPGCRPKSPRDLLEQLETMMLQRPWTEARAREWWTIHLPSSVASQRVLAGRG
jgi:eukaryotic-like serine/threonine-protein kinase